MVEAVRAKLGADAPVQVDASSVTIGDASAPRIGDCRIEYRAVTPQVVSVVAQATASGAFVPYNSPVVAGEQIDLCSSGSLSAAQMVTNAQQSNVVMKWVLRAVGFFLMWIGLNLTAAPLQAVASIIPFLGDIVGSLTSWLAFMVCVPLSLFTVAVAWI